MKKLYFRLKESKLNTSKIGFIIISIVATLWFLIRVIPKPSRAAYPCMRATAPFMSGLVVYLLSLFGGRMAFLRFKKSWSNANYTTAFGFLFITIGAFVLFLGYNSDFTFAINKNYIKVSDIPNMPIGTAVGYYPGRVVWVHDPNATNQNCKNTAGDYWYQNTNIKVVDKMLDDAVMSLTNSTQVDESWDKLFRNFNVRKGKGKVGYQPGEKIVIKINTTNTAETQYKYGARMDATPEVLYAVLRQLIEEVGVKQKDIFAGDPYRCFADPLWNLCHTAFPDIHYIDAYGKYGREQTKISSVESLVFSDKEYKSRLPLAIMEAAYLINMPTMKSHSSSGISLTAKNHQGSVLASDQKADSQSVSFLHYDFPDGDHNAMGQYRHLVDYMGHEKLGGNTVLFLVDAIWSGTDWSGAVEKWGMSPFNNGYTSSLFLSQDGVAVESVCYDFLYKEYSGYTHRNTGNVVCDFPLWPAVEDYIHQAASSDYWPKKNQYDPEGDGTILKSLGVHEHWNNPADKEYSGNLTGITGGINLISVPSTLVQSKPIDYNPIPTHFDNNSVAQLGQNKVRVYPNPFDNYFTVDLPIENYQEVNIEIYDISSKCIYSNRFNVNDIIRVNNLDKLSSGIYLLKVIANKKTYTATISK
jgi:hypothetical protein